jgi:hypothetical protein
MRLGFDLDGTLADMQAALAREARVLFPTVDPDTLPRSAAPELSPAAGGDAPSEPEAAAETDRSPDDEPSPFHTDTLSARQQRELWNAVRARVNFWETLDEIEPGALARLARLVSDRRWEVIFLTSRPETAGDSAQMQSHRWLAAHGFPAPSVFVVYGSRGKIASALQLDVLVDDRPENCLDVAIDSTARPILVWRGDEEKVPASARQLGIGAVNSIAECLDILEALHNGASERTGMVDRLKRLLGLRPRAARRRGPAPEEPAIASANQAASSGR